MLPTKFDVNHQVFRIRDLMSKAGLSWNSVTISNNFANNIRDVILNTPISREQDSFVWAPSKSERFFVKSCYRENNKKKFHLASHIDWRLWKYLWHSSLHERHKVLVWKLLVNILPTKDRIKYFVSLPDLNCFLCDPAVESISHFLFDCPIVKLCW